MNTEQNQWVGTDANYIISTHAIDLADWYKKATGAKRVNFLTHGQVKLERHRQRAIVSKSQNPRVSWLFTVTDWSNSKETGLGTLRPHSLPSCFLRLCELPTTSPYNPMSTTEKNTPARESSLSTLDLVWGNYFRHTPTIPNPCAARHAVECWPLSFNRGCVYRIRQGSRKPLRRT